MLNLKYNIASTLILLILDYLWLTTYMSPRYKTMIKTIQGTEMKPNMIYAVLSYFLMVVGLNHFVLPNIDFKNVNVKDCLKYGFLFGIVLYGVYDFTCATVIQKWDIKLALVDILWGGIVYFLSCYLLKFL
jgi:uncharacterized membrane protein